jgi:transcriptional regulator with XRE-family HTH domain
VEHIITYLPNNLSFLREQKKITQTKLADMLGCKPQTISGWETSYRTPDLYDIVRMSKIFGVNADDLMCKDLEKEYYNIKKYTKKEVKEKVTHIVSNSELEENKKQTTINFIEMVCEENE